jgi:hypothetical protein
MPNGQVITAPDGAAAADTSGAGQFGPNPATNPNFTHPGHRPPGGADAASTLSEATIGSDH